MFTQTDLNYEEKIISNESMRLHSKTVFYRFAMFFIAFYGAVNAQGLGVEGKAETMDLTVGDLTTWDLESYNIQ